MTTDTGLALLEKSVPYIEHHPDCYRERNGINGDCMCGAFLLAERITALLDSGIKDAGDDVVIPKSWIDETDPDCPVTVVGVHSYNELLCAYKRVKMERDAAAIEKMKLP